MITYIILGIIQGLTEFFPVSSSAHLVITEHIMKADVNTVATAVVLHLGTVLALLIFFLKDVIAALRNLKLILFIVIVTLITGIIGLSGKDFFERLFSSVQFVGFSLIVTGLILIFTKKFLAAKRDNVNFKDAVILGIAQGIAIIPGISRSGITISTLLFRGVKKEQAFVISFLASIPAVCGAALLEAKDISFSLKTDFLHLCFGFIASLVSGIFALWLLRIVLRKAKLHYFGYYCIILAIVTLLFIK